VTARPGCADHDQESRDQGEQGEHRQDAPHRHLLSSPRSGRASWWKRSTLT
jgi:hypothetical protein